MHIFMHIPIKFITMKPSDITKNTSVYWEESVGLFCIKRAKKDWSITKEGENYLGCWVKWMHWGGTRNLTKCNSGDIRCAVGGAQIRWQRSGTKWRTAAVRARESPTPLSCRKKNISEQFWDRGEKVRKTSYSFVTVATRLIQLFFLPSNKFWLCKNLK